MQLVYQFTLSGPFLKQRRNNSNGGQKEQPENEVIIQKTNSNVNNSRRVNKFEISNKEQKRLIRKRLCASIRLKQMSNQIKTICICALFVVKSYFVKMPKGNDVA